MLSQSQIDAFDRQGYLVVEDVLPLDVLAAVRAEYEDLLDGLYADWQTEGRVGVAGNEITTVLQTGPRDVEVRVCYGVHLMAGPPSPHDS